MARLILAFDESDMEMGTFNRGCKEDFEEFLNSLPTVHDTRYIDSSRMNAAFISITMSRMQEFVFAAYSHGRENSLNVNGANYVACDENHGSFVNSFFYTVSCHSAKQLGSKLVESGCRCYIGYSKEFYFWDGWKEFGTCANFGLFRFMEGCSTYEAFRRMEEEYDRVIDEVVEKDALVAASLSANKRGLKILGLDFRIDDWK